MWLRAILGLILCLVGGTWIAQGAGALHGSFMTGHAVWAVIGAFVLFFGGTLLLGAARSRARRG